MPSKAVRLSVRLSVTCRYTKWLSISSNFFHIRVVIWPTILVFFRTKRYGNTSSGTPLTSLNAEGYEKIAIFGDYLALSRK